MKVCLVSKELYPYYYGGIGTQFYHFAKELASAGNDVLYLTKYIPEEARQELNSYYENIEIAFLDESSVGCDNLVYSELVKQKFHEVYSKYHFDIVLSCEFQAETVGILCQKYYDHLYKSVKFITHISGPTNECVAANNTKLSKIYESQIALEDLVVSLSDTLIFPSSIMKEKLLSRLKSFGCKSVIIPNALNHERFSPKRHTLQPGCSKDIIFCGRLEKLKGVDLLLMAFVELREIAIENDLRLVLIGSDTEWPEYGESFKSYWAKKIPKDLQERVIFKGTLDQKEVQECYEKAWVGVFPSRWEPFGIAALEVLYSGLPIIVNCNTGLGEIIGDSYPVRCDGSLAELKDNIIQLLDAEYYGEVCDRSYKRAEEQKEQSHKVLSNSLPNLVNNTGSGESNLSPQDQLVLVNTFLESAYDFKKAGLELSSVWSKLDLANDRIKDYDALLSTKESELSSVWSKLDLANDRIKDYDALLSTKESELSDVWSKLDLANGRIRDYDALLSTKESELSDVWSKLDLANGRIKDYDALLSTKESELSDVWSKLEAANERIRDYDALLSTKESELPDV